MNKTYDDGIKEGIIYTCCYLNHNLINMIENLEKNNNPELDDIINMIKFITCRIHEQYHEDLDQKVNATIEFIKKEEKINATMQ